MTKREAKRKRLKTYIDKHGIERKTCNGESVASSRNAKRFCKHREQHREFVLRTKFGLTPADYNRLADAQEFGCAICGKPKGTGVGQSRSLAVDHCHDTGKVRALLCGTCNMGLGYFKHRVSLLQDAVQYLLDHQ